MSRILVCYKWVADEADVKVKSDLSVDMTKAKWKISDYDRNAIEAAVQAAAFLGGEACGLNFGTAAAKPSLKDALSRGLAQAYWINAQEAANADGAVTAKALAAAINKIPDVSLVICAEGASDTYARQTAPRMGAILDWPVITSVTKMEFDGNQLTAVRKLEDCLQTVKVQLPAVVSILPEINDAPIPGLKAAIAAGKKPVSEFKPGDLGIDYTPKTKVIGQRAYVMHRKNIILTEGDVANKVKELISNLRKEGVL
jgi:electron transfer flavoprotein beta subunit